MFFTVILNKTGAIRLFIEEKIVTKVENEYDVAVCGGGFAGISAALASARCGKKTVLFEKEFTLGGLGTLGLVTIFLPLCDGMGHQVSYGIAEELLRLSILHGAEAKYPDNWLCEGKSRGESDKRFEVQYNPSLFALLAEKLLTDAGVNILYGTYAVSVKMSDSKITHIITENKSGRLAYKVKSVVDATGDCDIAKFSGAPTDVFKQGNVLAAWYYSLSKNGYNLNTLGFCDIPDEEKNENNTVKHLTDTRFTGLCGEELSKQMRMAHEAIYNDFVKKRNSDPDIMPVTIPTVVQIRMTRKIVGEYVLSDKETHKHFDDSVGMVSDWKKRGPIYEVPFGTLYSKQVKNLICAGRCTSVTDTMWDIMRVIPCCAVTGQAAGTAAAMTDDFGTFDVSKLQKVLKDNGVRLHEDEIL